MNVTRPIALTAAGLLAATALAGCSSDSGSDASTAELDARVTALEEQVAGLEAIIGRVIIADPAASLQQLQSDVASLEKEVADAQAAAGEASDELASEVTDLQESLDAAKKAVADAEAAAGDARDQLIVDAQARLAEFEKKIDELKEKIAEAVGSAAPSPEAS